MAALLGFNLGPQTAYSTYCSSIGMSGSILQRSTGDKEGGETSIAGDQINSDKPNVTM